MPNCIFCDDPLTAATKPEHILLNALGGKKATRRAVCTTCNERFGSAIDRAVTDQVAVLRNMLSLESGSGNPPPTLRNVKAGADTINLNNDGTLNAVHKPFTITTNPDGTSNLQIVASSVEEVAKHIPNIAGALKCTEERVMQLLASAKGTMVTRRPGRAHFPMSFGGGGATQSLVKSCLVLWATLVGNDEVKSEAFAAARAFVMQGGDEFSRNRVHLDSRYFLHVEVLTRRFGEFFNLIYIRSDEAGRVIGHFTLYNVLAWQLVLAESGGTPGVKIGLISNPMDPTAWSDTIADEIDIGFEWLNAPDYSDEFRRARERLAAAVAHAQQSALFREFGRISRRVFEKHGIVEGTAVTDPKVKRLILAEIVHRAGLHIMNLPHEESVSGAEIVATVNAQRKKA